MCGILCVLRAKVGGEAVRVQAVNHARRLTHRGPDWFDRHVSKEAVLCHQRLAINDLESGSQPISNHDKTVWLAVNGEIYNSPHLRQNVLPTSIKWQTKSDCECILQQWCNGNQTEAEVVSNLNELSGMFAFVLLDEKTDRFLIARDPIGIVPLYYGFDHLGAIWVASEMKAIHDVCVTVKEFPPGHFWLSDNEDEIRPYYQPAWFDSSIVPTKPFDLKELNERLTASVKAHLLSDAPWACLLSGGLDSSLITAIVCRLVPANTVNTFSIGLEGSPDLAAARVVAEYLGTIHHEIKFTVEQGIEALSEVIYHLESNEITTVRASTPMLLLARAVKSYGFKSVLSGDASDEALCGYLYMWRCPDDIELQKECAQKVKDLHKFDLLRSNKTMAAYGVESRIPFAETEFINYVMSSSAQDKLCGRAANGRIEKHLLRSAFHGYLPEALLWRQKQQFSDG